MNKNITLVLEKEQEAIAKFIIKGLTIKQMSEKLMCSTSTVSYKLNKMFKKHAVTSRREFVFSIVGKILDNKTQEIKKRNEAIKEFRNIISNLSKNKQDSDKFSFWENKAYEILDEIDY